jgi:hypothetical protein
MSNIALTQRKLADATSYVVRSTIDSATPAVLAAPFIITNSGTSESFLRVATLDELQTGAYSINLLRTFQDDVTDLTLVAHIGDTLRILNPPTTWDDTPLTSLDFAIAAVSAYGAVVSTPFACFAGPLSWELYSSGVLVASGNAGMTLRDDPVITTFIDSQTTSIFSNGADALLHLSAVQGYVNSLAVSADHDATSFRNYVPGNPVITMLPR